MDLAIDIEGIFSEIDFILTRVERNFSPAAGNGVSESVLQNVEWAHPPNFPRRSPSDPILKGLIENTITDDQYPYISRISRASRSNLPHIFIRGELTKFMNATGRSDRLRERLEYFVVRSLGH